MNKKFIGVIAVFLLFTGCAAQGKVFPYPFETAVIEIKHTGTTEGTTIVTIKGDDSVYESHLVTTVVSPEGPSEQKTDVTTVSRGEWTYVMDLNENMGRKVKNPVYADLKSIPEPDKMEYLNRLGINLPPTEVVPQSTGVRDFEGNQCDIYRIENEDAVWEVCLWNGIALFSTIDIIEPPIQNQTEVVSIRLDQEIPETVFQIPEGVEIIEN